MTNEELVLKYQEGNNNALNELIEQNKGIIHKLVNRYSININKSKVLEYDDLIQSGILGLIMAAKKYDFNNPMKAQFITYAIHYIGRWINNCVFGRGDKGKANTQFNEKCTSLNTPINENGDTELQEMIESEDYSFENVEEKIFIEELHKDLETLMNEKLTLKEREVLKLHYGWNNTEIMNYESIGELFNVSGKAIRGREVNALRKLRNTQWSKEHIKMFTNYGYLDDYHLNLYRSWGYI